MAFYSDVLVDEQHPRFFTKILSIEVWLIRRCLQYLFLNIKFPRGDYQPIVPRQEHSIV